MCGDCDLLFLQLERSSFPDILFVRKFLIGIFFHVLIKK